MSDELGSASRATRRPFVSAAQHVSASGTPAENGRASEIEAAYRFALSRLYTPLSLIYSLH